ncbi:AbrB/MazE/SpoVT family DNA-binding domain-containing protein [Paenibacillus cisolokensis]|uniref:AbrB/MazE/SpoVT family DNA-binding domain-containing protein n=1 Tax=Paenibacillus cisolokensis TaxID=1658519 RepID=UPI003D2ADE48
MKATGIVRNIDALGRLVIPAELRRTLNITDMDPIEIFVDGDQIVLKKYARGCCFCGNTVGDMHPFHDRLICTSCVSAIRRHADKIEKTIRPASK